MPSAALGSTLAVDRPRQSKTKPQLGVQIPIEAPLEEQCRFRARRGGSYR
jgi:hypothetical protein